MSPTTSDATAPEQGPSARHRPSDLARVTAMLAIPRGRLLAAIASATATLASAFALAAVSAWLITTAWTMPPVLDLTVAVVAVRALGISRGAFRWVDRMTTHDAALRGVVSLRTRLFTALAARPGDALTRLRRGDLLARLGDDAQEIGDHVIRAVVPVAVAIVMGVVAVATLAPLSLVAAASMLLALAVAGLVAPLASYRAARLSQGAVIEGRGAVTQSALEVIDDATALRLDGRLDEAIARHGAAQDRYDAAIDRAALPSAIASASVPAAMILAVLGSVLAAGPLWTTGTASAGAIGILFLLPLSAFEASAALPAAAAQVARSRAAAARIVETIGPEEAVAPAGPAGAVREPAGPGPDAPHLHVRDLAAGWNAQAPRVEHLDLDLGPGSRLAVVGPSGAGKSTLLLTLAGLLEPLAGTLELDGADLATLPEDRVRREMVLFAEDAHVFATTVRENLRVARGDVTDEEIEAALDAAGLAPWVASLPGGLGHMLGPDGTTVSGGERRRLLLARALLRRAPLTLLDEPTEHLDPERARALLQGLLTTGPGALLDPASAVVVVTHDRAAIPHGTTVLHVGPNT